MDSILFGESYFWFIYFSSSVIVAVCRRYLDCRKSMDLKELCTGRYTCRLSSFPALFVCLSIREKLFADMHI